MSNYPYTDFWGSLASPTVPIPINHGFFADGTLQVRGIDLSTSLFLYRQASIPKHGTCDVSATAKTIATETGHERARISGALISLVQRTNLWLYPANEKGTSNQYAIGRGTSKGRLTNEIVSLKKALSDAAKCSQSKTYFTVPDWYTKGGLKELKGKPIEIMIAVAYEASVQHTTDFSITLKKLRTMLGIALNRTLWKAVEQCSSAAIITPKGRNAISVVLLNPKTGSPISLEKKEWDQGKRYPKGLPSYKRTAYVKFIKTKIQIEGENDGELLATCRCNHKQQHGKPIATLTINLQKSRDGMYHCFECACGRKGGSLPALLAENHSTTKEAMNIEAAEYIKNELRNSGKESL